MTNVKKFQLELAASEAKAALISSETNQFYLSDFSYTDGYILVTETEAILLTDSRYIEAANNTVTDLEVVLANDGMIPVLKKLISDKGIKLLMIEEAELSCADYNKLSESFGDCRLVFGASDILTALRRVKNAEEIRRMKEAQRITDAAFAHILEYITPDRTELDVALELEFFMRRMGAEGLAFDTIAVSGPASSLPHGVPSDIKLRRGFLTMDFGARYKGYCSDMTRTVSIGKADDGMKEVYNTVLNAQVSALNAICGGMVCRDADEIARSVIRNAGYGKYFGHSLGHGVGLFIHESPRLAPATDPSVVLEAGNVVTVEPGIYLEGKYGCRIEDMIAINEDGSVYNFTESPKQLIEI